MELAIFAAHITTNGKDFYNYTTRLPKKDGSILTVRVKFRKSCGLPMGADCPMNIKVKKEDMNLVVEPYDESSVDEDTGEVTIIHKESYRLWVSKWEKGSPYVDHSLDDFDIK